MKRLKSTLAIFIIISITCSLIPIGTIAATANSMTVASVSGKPGSTVTVPVDVVLDTSTSPSCGIGILIYYDSSILTFSSMTKYTSNMPEGALIDYNTYSTGNGNEYVVNIIVDWVSTYVDTSTYPNGYNDTVLDLNFTINPSAAPGDTALTFDRIDSLIYDTTAYNNYGSTTTLNDGSVTVLGSHSITYDANSALATGSVPSDGNSYYEDDSVTILGNTGSLALEGKTFIGWSTSSTATIADYTAGSQMTMPNSDVTLYAVWTGNELSYTGGTLAEGTYGTAYTASVATAANGTGAYTYATTSTLPEGLTLSSTGELAGTPTSAGSYEIVVTATDSNSGATATATFTLTINAAGTVEAPTASLTPGSVEKGTEVTLSTTTSDATIYYTTDGTDPTTSSNVYSGAITINEAVTIKAIAVKTGHADSAATSFAYTIATHTVSYDGNGGTGDVPTDSGIYYNGDTVTVQFAPEPTRAGYVFAGWATSATAESAEYTQGGTASFAMGTADLTLYAVWSDIDRAVTYNANGATSGSVPEDTTPYSAGVSTTVLDNTGSLEKTGYTFTGWSTVSDATEASYLAGDSITATDRITLYAVWVPYTYTSSDGKVTITKYTGTETAVTVPETIAKLPVTVIGSNAFAGNTVMTTVAIPDSVTALNGASFRGCTALETVSFGAGSQLKYMWTNVFEGCGKLTTIELPATLTTISDYTFKNCTSLESLTMPDTVTLTGQQLFYGCTNLKTVHISTAAPVLKTSVFEGCTSLTTITVPESVTTVANRAFYGCTSLAEAKFAGSAPATFGTEVFDAAASDFKVLYNYEKTGWSTPSWNGYTAYPSCTISYDANGGTGDVPIDSGIYYNGNTVTVQFAPEPTRAGYVFAGWAASATAATADYTAGGTTSFAMGTEPVTMYAVWTSNELSYTGGTLAEGTYETAYTASVATAVNGTGTYTYATTSTLPTGVTLSSAGELTGTPAETGSYEIVVTATDSNSGATATATFTLTIRAAGTVEAPTASLTPGTVEKGTEVTLSTATSDATIYYTTDGTDPTTSSNVYSGAIIINETVTIKAIAVKDGHTNSAIASFAYSIATNSMTIANVSGKPGSTVTVPVDVVLDTSTSPSCGIGILIYYDSSILTFSSMTKYTSNMPEGALIDYNTYSTGNGNEYVVNIIVDWVSTYVDTSTYPDGYSDTVLDLNFTINPSATPEDTALTFDRIDSLIYDTTAYNNYGLTTTLNDGSVTVLGSHSITYDANSALATGSVPSDGNSYYEDDIVTILGNTGLLALEGKTFVGWSTSSTATSADYTADSQMTMPNSDVTLYAVWSDIDRAVTYDANGATGGSVPEDTTPYSAGVSITVLDNIGSLEKTGYTFTGWSTVSDATEADYVAGDSITATDRMTLYAVWTPYTYTSSDGKVTITKYTGTETAVTVPETIAKLPVTVIGSSAFAGNTVMTTVAIPDSVTALNGASFRGCTALETVSFGENSQLKYMWTNVFEGCANLKTIEIPATVTTISDYTFKNCTSLESLTMPDTVTLTGQQLFYGCTNLKTVHISTAAPVLKTSVFEGCTSLTTITVPESVTTVANRAFYGCTNLSEAKFAGNAPATFGTEVFDAAASDFKVLYNYEKTGWSTPSWNGYTAYPSCTVTYDANGGTGDVPTDSGIYYNGDTVTVQFAPEPTRAGYVFAGWAASAAAAADYTQGGTTSFAMGTEPITLYAVWTSNELSYTGEALTAGTYGTPYTASVATAANGTGAYTYTTTSTLPEGLTLSSAGELAGTPTETGSYEIVVTATDSNSGATATATFTLTINAAGTVEAPTASLTPGSVEKGTEVTLNTTTSDATIYYTTDGTDPTTSSNVYSGAITINEEVTIKAIAVKTGYANSAATSFAYTIAAHTVSYDGNGGTGDVPTDSGIYYNGDTVTVQFAPEPTRAGYVFAGWATSATAESAEYTQGGTTSFAMGTENVTLYAVWSEIDRAVTYDTNGATGGSVPEDTTPYSAGVSTTVLDNTGSLEKTGYTFTGWSTVSDATEADYVAGDSITATDRITLYAVWVPYTYTSSDGKVTITKYTGTETAVTVPETIEKLPVTAIGGSVFAGKAVTAVTLPSSLTSMSNYAFQNCSALTSIAIPDGVTQLSNYLFADCSELTTVSFGSSSQLEYIWTNAFKGCSKLTDIAIPTTVTTISNSAFEGCSSLQSITIPDKVTLLGEKLFYGCTSLTTVHISAAATYLKPSMFEGCTSLTTITIPEKVTTIGNRAFYGCTNLSEAKFAGNAPGTFGTEVFDAAASNFKVLYNYGTAGWSTPSWNGYTAYPSCTVSYDANGGTGDVPTDSGIYYNGDTVTVQFTELTKEGYSFAGWATSATAAAADYTQGGTTSFAMGTEPVTLYAVWTSNELSYTGGTLAEGTYGTAYTASVATAANGTGAYTYTTTSTLPEGLTLSSAGELAGTPAETGNYEIVVTATDSNSGATATATFTLTIRAAGTVEGPTASLTPGSVEKGTEVTLSTTTSDATIYYTTDGTDPTTSSNVYSGAITINEAVTIKAIAVKTGHADSAAASFAYTIATHTVSYDGNGGTGDIPTDSGIYYNGDTVTVQFTPEPTRAGYVFAGWAASATAATADYTQGGTTSFAMGTENVTLYAVWSDIDRAVTYDANGATGGSVPEDTTPYSAGVSTTVLDNTGSLEKTGYTFTGWSTVSDATEASYLAGDSITATDRITLYAVWVPYTYTSSDGKVTITKYTGTETAVTVPETIAKLPVTVIGSNAFAGNTVMTTVAIPDSVTALNGASFRGCTALETVSFGAGSQLKYMWTNVFEGCGKLTTIELPATLTTISDYTFKNCTSLESLTMPDTVTLTGQQLFYGCTNLKTVHISTAAPVLKTSVFEGCTSLTTITVPESVTTVANRAFYGCTSLAEAKFAGNAPGTFGTEVFDAAASDFKVLYNYGTAGWSTPSWNGYTAYPSCTVSYDANGGTGDVPTDSGIYYNGDTVTVQFAELTKEGYSFAGWATTATATSAEYTQGGTISFAMGTEPVTLYAVWTSNALSYTGGTLAEGTYETAYTASVATAANGTGAYTYTTTSTLPEGLTLSSAGELAGTPTSAGSYEIVVTATDSNSGATATATFTLTIRAAGTVEAPTASLTPGSVEKGTEVTLSTTTSDATIYYTTDGTDPTTSSNVYSGAITINEAVTIKAIAVKTGYVDSAAASFAYTIATHTVSYDGNGGTGDIPTDSGIYYNGDTVTVQFAPEPTRAGYVFAGWATSATAESAEYTQGGTASFAIGTENVTLYAVWTNAAPTFTIVPNATHQNLRFVEDVTIGGTTYNLIRGLNPLGEKVNAVMKYFEVENGYWKLYKYAANNYTSVLEADTSTAVGTNFKIEIYDDSDVLHNTYYVVIMGDLNSDGKVTNADMVITNNHITSYKLITEKTLFYAADINGSSTITNTDVVGISNHATTYKLISQ